MTLDEFYNLSKRECFERIIDESRTQAKRRLCFSLIGVLIFIVILICTEIWNYREFDIVDDIYACLVLILCFVAAWIAVNNFRLLKRLNSIDSPEQLLHCYEKTIKNNFKVSILALIACVVDPYAFINDDKVWLWLSVTITVAVIAFLIYCYYNDILMYKTRRDEEIIDRLQDLIDRK